MKTDTLGHLIEIESKAAAMLMDAQTEADRRTAEVRSQADADYKVQYEKLVNELESETERHIRTLKQQYDTAFDAYKAELAACAQDASAFNGLLKNLLCGN
ncbi:hypothetical protein V1L52_11660 [Treponema sp. HNW]|uniref:hypothetical protein n=1 Tax=Treponema sp. HNW TaxID=3116654 RepID=UPI003D0BD48A